jgi:hypothetical protein
MVPQNLDTKSFIFKDIVLRVRIAKGRVGELLKTVSNVLNEGFCDNWLPSADS